MQPTIYLGWIGLMLGLLYGLQMEPPRQVAGMALLGTVIGIVLGALVWLIFATRFVVGAICVMLIFAAFKLVYLILFAW